MRTIFILLALCLFYACNKKQEYREERGTIFHTSYLIKYEHHSSLQNEIEEELLRFDNSLNPFKPTSTISKVNNNEEVVLDTLFTNVFMRAQEVSAASGGLFDITLSPLINAWGFGFKNMENINSQTIDSLRPLVGYDKVKLQNGKIIKTEPRIQLNASAIAKGYATDVIARLLESYGIENFMIEIGGEIHAKGVSPKGYCWHVGIARPVDEGVRDYEELQSVVRLCNQSMATSGSSRKYYIKGGKKYAHTIDPRTGYPSEMNTLSATVVADDCMTADAFATVFMLADTASVRKIAEREKLAYMLIIGDSDSTYLTVKSRNFNRTAE